MPNDSQGCDGIAANPVEFHEDSGSYTTEFDFPFQQPSEAVVATVTEAKDEDVTDLPPLFSKIDPDALNTIFATTLSGEHHCDGCITFEYAECQISVNSCGKVAVSPL